METDLKAKAMALSVVKALVTHDAVLLDQAISTWNVDAEELLLFWCVEAITHRWGVFTEKDLFGITDYDLPLDVIRTLGFTRETSPKLRGMLLRSLV